MKLYGKGLEEYSKANAIVGNIVMITWIILGTIACWFLYPVITWFYLAFVLIMIYIVLRKLVCINCYYYDKWCGIGWGKLSALFFKKGKIEKFNESIGLKIAPITYGVLTVIPIILIVVSLIQKVSIYKIAVLVLLVLIAFYSGGISRKKTCANCKMRLVCTGSAVK